MLVGSFLSSPFSNLLILNFQVAKQAYAKAGTKFATPAIQALSVAALAKHVQAAAEAGYKSFTKHITPQLELLERSTHFDVRLSPATDNIDDQAFYGVSDIKYVPFCRCLLPIYLLASLVVNFFSFFPRWCAKYTVQYKMYTAEHAEQEQKQPGYWHEVSNYAYWTSKKQPELSEAALTWL